VHIELPTTLNRAAALARAFLNLRSSKVCTAASRKKEINEVT